MKRVALITCRVLPEPDPDQELQLAALRARGLHAEMLAWDDPSSDPGAFDLCVMRSCWDYYRDPDAFLAFVARASRASRLINSESAVRWNIHKSYLTTLSAAGVPVIPTEFFEAGHAVNVAGVTETRGWDDVVMKPAISAGSSRIRRFGPAVTGGQSYMEFLLADGDAMMQRYMEGFATTGERALIWIDGEFTHKVVKSPRFDGEDESVSRAYPVSDEERALGQRVLACVDERLYYARVDVVEHDGGLVVSEFEIMEPSLFFAQCPDALTRLAGTIERLAGQ